MLVSIAGYLSGRYNWAKMVTDNNAQAHRASFQKLRRELTIERVAFLVYIALTISYMVLSQRADQPWAICVDGKRIAIAPNRPTYAALVAEARRQQSHQLSNEVRIKQKIEPRYVGRSAKPDGLVDALSAIERVTTVEVKVWAIVANGCVLIGSPSKAAAQGMLDALKLRYAGEVKSLYEEPRIKEKVRIRREWLAPQRVFRAIDNGVAALMMPAGKPVTHVVQKDELAITIAKKHGISLKMLQEFNPGRVLDRLQIGDVLRVGAGDAPITVVVKAVRKTSGGGREIVTYENGVEVRGE